MSAFLGDPDIALAALMLAAIADVATTRRGLSRGGREAHPVVAWLMDRLGELGALAVKLAATLAAGALIMATGPVWALWLAAAATAAVAIHNYREVN